MMRVRKKVLTEKERKRRRKRVSKIYPKLIINIECFINELEKKKGANYAPREQDNSHLRNLGNWTAEGDWK